MSIKTFFQGIVLLALVGCSVSCSDKEDRIKATQTTISESVYSSLTVQPDSLYQVYAAVSGILDRNLLEEGDPVNKGTPVVQIINNAPQLNVENARLNLDLAIDNYSGNNAVIRTLEDEIRSARLNVQNDSVNYFRQKNLWDQNIGSHVEYDTRKLAYELSVNNLSLLLSNFARTKNELRTKVIQAENNYKTAQITTGDFTVESKINGTVYALYKNHGESVSTLEPLAAIGSSNDFIVDMLVDEVDIVKIKLGQHVLITLDAYNSEVFEAEVSKIYPRKDQRSQTFKVEAIFKAPPEVLYPGLAGEGNIVVGIKENALTIPRVYLIDNNKVRTEDGLIQLDLGLQNLELVEVLSGLDKETYILKPE
ncbi:MAG: efflux RND transporter periplasmic adaptor subunit [Flavobacteriaceae bacterium]